MRLDEEQIVEIMERLPALEAAPLDIRELALSIEDVRLQRTFAAAAWLQRTIQTGLARPWLVRRLRLVTFGFISTGKELRDERQSMPSDIPRDNLDREDLPRSGGFMFGISVLADLTPERLPQALLDVISLGETRFPVIATNTAFEPHNAPPHVGAPSTIGSSACWAEYHGNRAVGWTLGVVTARHTVKHLAVGTSVALDPSSTYTSPSQGWVADHDACSIDAAIIGIDPKNWPTAVSSLSTGGPYSQPIAPGQNIAINGRTTHATGKVVSHHPLPAYWGDMMGQRLVIDAHGVKGDSGALVEESPSGNGVGIYMGTIDDGAGGKNGLCQDLHQASIYFEMNLHR